MGMAECFFLFLHSSVEVAVMAGVSAIWCSTPQALMGNGMITLCKGKKCTQGPRRRPHEVHYNPRIHLSYKQGWKCFIASHSDEGRICKRKMLPSLSLYLGMSRKLNKLHPQGE